MTRHDDDAMPATSRRMPSKTYVRKHVLAVLARHGANPDRCYPWNISREFDVSSSATYTNLKAFADYGWVVEERESERDPGFDTNTAGRPERIHYRITDLGRTQLTMWRRPRTRRRR